MIHDIYVQLSPVPSLLNCVTIIKQGNVAPGIYTNMAGGPLLGHVVIQKYG